MLVVEDVAKMAGLLKRVLEEEGYAVDVAGTGSEAAWHAPHNQNEAQKSWPPTPNAKPPHLSRSLSG